MTFVVGPVSAWEIVTPGRCVVCGDPVEIAKAVRKRDGSRVSMYYSISGPGGPYYLRSGEMAASCGQHPHEQVEAAVVLTIPSAIAHRR